ncbi:MAG: hypothetical protein M1831_002194 [Alyxoria varia]|nr:MAG: hypothetical protein M1831_002194 [Alyxoria varia]
MKASVLLTTLVASASVAFALPSALDRSTNQLKSSLVKRDGAPSIPGKDFTDEDGVPAAAAAAPVWLFAREEINGHDPCYPEQATNAKGDGPNPGTGRIVGPNPGEDCRDPPDAHGLFTLGDSFPNYITTEQCNPGEWRITYSLYYVHDGAGSQGHKHDWESATVVFKEDAPGSNMFRRDALILSAHDGKAGKPYGEVESVAMPDDVSKTDERDLAHPKVYVSFFKHANYFNKDTRNQVYTATDPGAEYRSDDWFYMGAREKGDFVPGKTLDAFYIEGGNFIDTSNTKVESWIGEWLELEQNRDEMVIATKFTAGVPPDADIGVNYEGNYSKSLTLSIEASFRRLRTTYVDLLYVHFWDFTTSIPELMHSLHHLIAAEKVLYIGVCNTPAWIVSKANEYARQKGLTQFSVYQGRWNAMDRDFERDILPMAEAEGMALAPEDVLGYRDMLSHQRTPAELVPTPDAVKVRLALCEAVTVGARKVSPESKAIAYVRHKSTHVFPVVGCRSIGDLKDKIAALGVAFPEKYVDQIDKAIPFDIGYLLKYLYWTQVGQRYKYRWTANDIPLLKVSGSLDTPRPERPPKPHT